MSVYDRSAYVAERRYRKVLWKDLRDGALAGFVAGSAIIILFFFYDVLSFRPLATPEFLSRTLLGGAELGAVANELNTSRITIFTILHLVTFTLLGIILARFFRFTQMHKTVLMGGLYGVTACTIFFGASMQVTGTQMSAEPGWPAVLAGNLAAGIVMVIFLRRVQGAAPS